MALIFVRLVNKKSSALLRESRHTLVIGLTGSIGTGKSTIAKMFQARNIPVIDADLIAREVVEPGKEAYRKIVEAFGEEVLQEDRSLDRKKLGALVFSDDTKRERLIMFSA